MSWLKAAAVGFSDSGAKVANKYVDEKLAQDRALFMAELQRTTAGRIREEDFAFKTDPSRVQTMRDIAAGDAAASAKSKRDADMAGWNDAAYQSGLDAQVERETQAQVRRRGLMAEADAKAQAKYRAPGGGGRGGDDPFAKLPPAVRAAYGGLVDQAKQINAAIVKSQADGMWEPDKNRSQSDLLVRMRVLEDKSQALLEPYLPARPGARDSDDETRKMLMGEGRQQPPSAAAPTSIKAPRTPPGPLAGMDERTLQRLASIDGHQSQASAIDELKRRGKWRQKSVDDTQGIDFTSAAPT